MPHTPETRARELAKRKQIRHQWLEEKGPCRKCGSKHQLELDHIDPTCKVSHAVWSWTKRRRDAELEKCQVLCRRCHKEKTAIERARFRGRVIQKLRKISDKGVLKAVLMRKAGKTVRSIGVRFGVSHAVIVRLTNAAMKGEDFRHRGIGLNNP